MDDPTLAARPLHRGSGCHECRRRKLKCSGTKPMCDRCVRSGTQCAYDPVEKSKVALLRDEVLVLRQKVKTLEAQARPTLHPVSASTSSPSSSPSRPTSSPSDASPTMRRSLLPIEDQAELLSQFIAIQHLANEYVSFPRQAHTSAEFPAGKTSAYLLASHFSPAPHLHALSPKLLESARHSIDESIRIAGQSPNSAPLVLDAIHASSLLASWMLIHARMLESQQALFGAAKLAILSGLHKMTSLDVPGPSDSPPLLVSRPTSHADVKYRVGLFWQLLCLDYTAAILMGPSVSVSLPWEDCPAEVQVETAWPTFESCAVPSSISSLFSAQAPSRAIDAGALRAKSIVLLERAVRVSALWRRTARSVPPSPTSRTSRSSSASTTAWNESVHKTIQQTDRAISEVMEQLPLGVAKGTCLVPHTLLLCARVRLHETLAQQDRVSQVVWVQSAVAIVRLLDGMDVKDVINGADLLLAYSWLASYMVMMHEHYFVPYLPESEHAIKIRADLDKLGMVLKGLGERMPVVESLHKTALEQFHAQSKPVKTED